MRFLGLSRETVPRALSGKFLSVKIEGKGEKIRRRKIFFVEEKKSREGIGGKYFEKENIFSRGHEKRRRKMSRWRTHTQTHSNRPC